MGKKTNQQEIMGKKYSIMSENEFENFILNKEERIKTRMRNLRKKYLNG